MQAIRVHQYGGPDVMRLEELQTPRPGPGEVLVRVRASGVNFVDINYRAGIGKYRGALPITLGVEGAGVVEELGPGVDHLVVGIRIAWTGVPGSYSTHVVVPVDKLVALPAGVDFEQGAAAMLQGMTAHYLSHSAYPLEPSSTCLVHAAAGGVGRLLCQMAKMRGAGVLATVSTPQKAKVARAAGADHVILYTQSDFVAEVRRLTGGKGVNVIYDSVGQATFERGLDCLTRRGVMIVFGQASGPVPPIDALTLNVKGSIYVTWPSLMDYVATREDLLCRAGDVLKWIEMKQLNLHIHDKIPLAEAPRAHRALEARSTIGKLLLIP
jgi:NADPH2:quinone reductase